MIHLRTGIRAGIAVLALVMATATAKAHVISIDIHPSKTISQAKFYISTGETDRARAAANRALSSDLTVRQSSQAHNVLCVSYFMDEYWDEALQHCNKAISISARNWRFYNNKGNIFLETGQYEKALEEYKHGLSLAPNSITIQHNIELARTRAGLATTDGA